MFEARAFAGILVDMSAAPTIELLSWLAARSRTYDEAIDAWRSHCPRLTVWEDALIEGFIRIERSDTGSSNVALTDSGRALLEQR